VLETGGQKLGTEMNGEQSYKRPRLSYGFSAIEDDDNKLIDSLEEMSFLFGIDILPFNF